MWSKYPKKVDKDSSESKPNVWSRLKINLEEDILHNWYALDKDGVEAGKRVQKKNLSKMGPRNAWERLFVMGMIKDPESTEAIKEARDAFHLLTEPILSNEEKRRPLEDIHEGVRKIAGKLSQLTDMNHAEATELLHDLEEYEILLEDHAELAQTDGEAMLLLLQTAADICNLKRYISTAFANEET